MTESGPTTTLDRHRDPIDFADWPEISRIRTDRFCHRCGYNLHTQIVRREPRTELLVSRCPECGTYHPVGEPANRFDVWRQRGAAVILVAWMGVILSLATTAGISQGGLSYFTLDEFTTYQGRRRIGQVYTHQLVFSHLYLHRPWDRAAVVAISASCSLGLGFVTTCLALVFMPHWRRPAHWVVIFIWAIVPGIFVALIWREEAPDLLTWSLPYIGAYTACYIAGGLLAVSVGRGLIRLVVRICLPPKWRRPLDYLWTADGLQLPG